MVSRRAVISGGGAVVIAATVVGLGRAGGLDGLVRMTGVSPARQPDSGDKTLLDSVRRRHTRLLDLAEASAHDADDTDETLRLVVDTLNTALNRIGGPAARRTVSPADEEDIREAVQHAASECATDATDARSSALVRTVASMSIGLEQLAVVLQQNDTHG